MIVLHEFGHWLAFKVYDVKYIFTFNKEHVGFDFEDADDEVLFWIYAFAILLGFVPLVFFGAGHNIYVELAVLGCYLWGITFDLKQIGKLVRKK